MKNEAVFNLTFPAVVIGPIIVMMSLHYIPLTMGMVVIGLMIVSVASLFYARFPFYKERRFFKIGPGGLDRKHRKWYFFSYICLTIAIFILILLLMVLKDKQ
jgi:hypothetical protein